MDPREMFDTEAVAFEDVKVGMWVSKSTWRRPRLVVAQEQESYFVLAEPDESRQDEHGNRQVTRDAFDANAWRTYPNLNNLWDAAFSGN